MEDLKALADIPKGDMPGDIVNIAKGQVTNANIIFPKLLEQLKALEELGQKKMVVAVCGGSGAGKSGIASLLTWYLTKEGIGSYTLSGDNYPHRIPKYNDAERLRIFRSAAVRGMVEEGSYTKKRFEKIQMYQRNGDDANPAYIQEDDWYASYLEHGRKGLKGYLGTQAEIDFAQIESVLKDFKDGKEHIWLKRMGREESDIWYDEIDFSGIRVLVLEWTHGNSENLSGVDIPVLLCSTPLETLEHRKSRNRDGGADSPFTTMVLELEQDLLDRQAHKAKMILSKSGKLLSYEQYQEVMKKK